LPATLYAIYDFDGIVDDELEGLLRPFALAGRAPIALA
jgi:hypothetical protein